MVIDCRCIILYLFVVYCFVDVSGCWFSVCFFFLVIFCHVGICQYLALSDDLSTLLSKLLRHLSICWKIASLEIIYVVYRLILLCSCHGLSQRFPFPTGLWHKKTTFFLITLIIFLYLPQFCMTPFTMFALYFFSNDACVQW